MVWGLVALMPLETSVPSSISSSKTQPHAAQHGSIQQATPTLFMCSNLRPLYVCSRCFWTAAVLCPACRLLGFNTVRLPFRYKDLDQYTPSPYVSGGWAGRQLPL